ncbi:response regulator [Prevotella sp. E13-17]|uniref:hybrid sensor histidine kinase/response regulator transcription factor n=1 Tax=Prevotella sp. E13-17 TaxID=2913616 RepID=UPI001EDAACFF|nr:response regulator [Prevotella sp. E13-17]UKK51119.1 response regulator [Prevotella sp. E13-17]
MALIAVLVILSVLVILLTIQLRVSIHRRKMMQQTIAMRERFLLSVVHEFRDPLSLIKGLGQQLEKPSEENNISVPTTAGMLVRQTETLLALVTTLLDITRVQSVIGEAKWRHGNVVAYVGMILQNHQHDADSKRQHLRYHHSLTSIEMDFVPAYIHRVLSKLLANAIKYTGDYGNIDVSLEVVNGAELMVQVKDNGAGIAPDLLPRIFDMCNHADNSMADAGTMLSLPMAKMMVEAMRGRITVESVVGKGSTFSVRLPMKYAGKVVPLVASEADTTASLSVESEKKPADNTLKDKNLSALDSSVVLIVEDNQDLAYYIGMHLKQCKLIYARSAKEGMEKALENMPDIIITDVTMPGDKDGLELCRQVKNNDQLNHTPVIIISAQVTEDDKIRGLEAGADAYLMKPFNSEELVVRVRKLIERQRLLKQKFEEVAGQAEVSVESLPRKDRAFMTHLLDVVYRLMASGNVDIESVAKEMAMSRSQLNRRMLAITNQNSSTYIMQLRLARAKRLLKADVNMTIGDVAQRCGFDDVAYFSRIFKQTFDITPSQYRKQI